MVIYSYKVSKRTTRKVVKLRTISLWVTQGARYNSQEDDSAECLLNWRGTATRRGKAQVVHISPSSQWPDRMVCRCAVYKCEPASVSWSHAEWCLLQSNIFSILFFFVFHKYLLSEKSSCLMHELFSCV